MAVTRGSTGNSKPRIVNPVSTEPVQKRGSTKKATTANTSKPRSSTASSGVTKKKAPATHHKRTPSVKDKVEGAGMKLLGKIEGKPGKVGAGTKKMRGTDGKGSHKKKTAEAVVEE